MSRKHSGGMRKGFKFGNEKGHLLMQKFLTILLITVFSISSLPAEKLNLAIKYIGLKIIDAEIEDQNNILNLTAKSSSLANILAKADNKYIIEYEDDYLPKKYTKIIKQSNYFENRFVIYDRVKQIGKRVSFLDSTKTCDYPIHPQCRDFFSALFYLRKNLDKNPGEIWLDANKVTWKVRYQVVDFEKLNSPFGKINTKKVKITFQKVSSEEKERSDILTNNLVNEKRNLYFWFSDDQDNIPIKAKYSMLPFSIIWKLEKYEK